MGQLRQPAQAFSVEGEVVEILQDVGRLRAKVVLRPGTVLDVPAIPSDMHLGDQVGIEGAITLERIRTLADAGESG
jgi:hypothetical protein